MKALLPWIYAHVQTPVKYKVQTRGEPGQGQFVKVGEPPSSKDNLESCLELGFVQFEKGWKGDHLEKN